ncbi:hypothetical protein K4G90_24895, partial [Mycobacterium tuberculosis]|nr:hypothetical protein [Mycobacterium tuberculosis]
MTGTGGAPDPWSYSPVPGTARPRKLSRRALTLGGIGIAVALLLVVALVTWLAWPQSAPDEQADNPQASKP